MPLTSDQNIPQKPRATEPWTFRKLFSANNPVSTLAKVFVNPLEVLLGVLVLSVVAIELIGHEVSSGLWFLTGMMLLCVLLERNKGLLFKEPLPVEKPKKDKK